MAAKLQLSDIRADALPDEKMGNVLEEIGNGRRLMVAGDGIDDALVLKAHAMGVMANDGRLLKFQDKHADH